MAAFCVYGVSRSQCRKQAERDTKTFVFDEEGNRRELTVQEWGNRVRAATERLFALASAEPAKRAKISPEFDAPQFCRDWIAASPGEVAHTMIMYRGPKVDKRGAVVMRLGQPVLTWLEYDQNHPWPRPFGEVDSTIGLAA